MSAPSLNRTELVILCMIHCLSSKGTQKQLIKRLNHYYGNSFTSHSDSLNPNTKWEKAMIHLIRRCNRNKKLLIVLILTLAIFVYIFYLIAMILLTMVPSIHFIFDIIEAMLIPALLLIVCIQEYPRYIKPDKEIPEWYELDGILSLIDSILFIYFIYLQQYIISSLFALIIIVNIWHQLSDYIRNQIYELSFVDIVLFHATFQLLPICLSLAFYETNDRLIDIVFIIISISFIYKLYKFSSKWKFESDTNSKIIWVIFVCVILDYIHMIMLILCNVYMTDNIYFYQFIPIQIFCILVYSVIVWRDFSGISCDSIWDWFWLTIWCLIGVPFCLEWGKLTWIALIYNLFLKQLRNKTNFKDEILKDELVSWLEKDKHNLLIKVCCIDHIKLIETNTSSQLLSYLEKNQQNYYKYVSWNGIQQNSANFKDTESLWSALKHGLYAKYNRLRTVSISSFGPLFYDLERALNATWIWIVRWIWIICLVYYIITRILHIFIWPFYTIWFMYDVINMYQGVCMVIYFVLCGYIGYKLMKLFQYERMMWYIIPDLEDLNCSRTDIDAFKQYYHYIINERFKIKKALSDVVGVDIATIVMFYVPDFLVLYKETNGIVMTFCHSINS